MRRTLLRDRAGGVLVACVLLALAGCATGGASGSASGSGNQLSEAARINLQLGVGYLQQGNLAVAKEKLDRAAEEDPRNPEIHGAMALLDARLGKDKDADKEFRSALRLMPNDPAMLNNYAVFLCSHARAVEGVRYFEQAANNPLYPTPWAAYTNAGVCLHAANQNAEALARFTRALQINPRYAEAVFQTSSMDFDAHRFGEARRRIDVFVAVNGATPDLLLLAWRCAGEQGDAAAQAQYAQRLAKEFPNSDQARALAASQAGSG